MVEPHHVHGHDDHASHTHRSHLQHKSHGPKEIGCMVITCSDSRTTATDTSGQLVQQLLQEQGHKVVAYHLIKDEPSEIHRLLALGVQDHSLHTIIINGGTGVSRRDSTFEAIDGILEKRLDGFGELFRYLSYKEIGSAAMLSRATAGLYKGKVMFSVPGSESAVRLAMEQLILPEIGHIVGELRK